MTYQPRCVETGKSQGDYRFLLEQAGDKMLVVIGVNPSTADESHPDPTMRRVMGFAEGHGYTGFAMLNLCAQRATRAGDLAPALNEEMHQKNLEVAADLIARYPDADILVAFGNTAAIRPYLKQCFADLHQALGKTTGRWLQLGDLTKAGYPRHPLYAPYSSALNPFDTQAFLTR